ncbi:MAG: hypothetical protein V1735_07080 [Nanoarchaeota archaeon]
MKLRWVVLGGFLLASALFLIPVLAKLGWWGTNDWDQHMFYHAAPAVSLLRYGQFPLWNPWQCGGSAMLANPQSAFLSPIFPFVLLFGAPVGLKLALLFHLAFGMWGMWLLGRHLKFSVQGSVAAAAIFFFSSWLSLRVVAGHTVYFCVAYLPFAVLFFLKAQKRWQFAILSGAMLGLMLLSGGVYMLLFSSLLLGMLGLFQCIQQRKARPLLLVFFVLIAAGLLGAVKLLPMLEFTQRYAVEMQDKEYTSWQILYNSFMSRNQRVLTQDRFFYEAILEGTPEQAWEKMYNGQAPWAWHEYGAYIGFLVLALVLLSFRWLRKTWILIALMILFLAITAGQLLGVSAIIYFLPFLKSLHGPSRFALLAVFCAALLAGFSLTKIGQLRRGRLIAWAVVALIILDLATVSMPVLSDAFVIKPSKIGPADDRFFQIIIENPYQTGQYSGLMQNLGTLNCYERVHPPISAIAAGNFEGAVNPAYRGGAFLAQQNKTVQVEFSPNVFTVSVLPLRDDLLVLNQNYDPGWKSSAGPVVNSDGLAAVWVRAGQQTVTFRYLPTSFLTGLAITLLAIGAGIYLWRRP